MRRRHALANDTNQEEHVRKLICLCILLMPISAHADISLKTAKREVQAYLQKNLIGRAARSFKNRVGLTIGFGAKKSMPANDWRATWQTKNGVRHDAEGWINLRRNMAAKGGARIEPSAEDRHKFKGIRNQ
jgi:hypothetical protein